MKLNSQSKCSKWKRKQRERLNQIQLLRLPLLSLLNSLLPGEIFSHHGSQHTLVLTTSIGHHTDGRENLRPHPLCFLYLPQYLQLSLSYPQGVAETVFLRSPWSVWRTRTRMTRRNTEERSTKFSMTSSTSSLKARREQSFRTSSSLTLSRSC